MIAGMTLINQGRIVQLARLTANPVGTDGPNERHSVYYLTPMDGGNTYTVTNPTMDDVALLPACQDCGTPAGFLCQTTAGLDAPAPTTCPDRTAKAHTRAGL